MSQEPGTRTIRQQEKRELIHILSTGHSMPAAKLADGIVSRALARSPATYYTAGGKAWLFWILDRLPRWVVWRALAKVLGADKVGQ